MAGFGRITPAGAGKTEQVADGETDRKDHPRRCGENLTAFTVYCTLLGSPPQVRGKRMKDAEKDGYLGITPAGAGKTISNESRDAAFADHPRRCGENPWTHRGLMTKKGSPPQVRGKRNPTYEDFGEDRITPAGAGKTNGAD